MNISRSLPRSSPQTDTLLCTPAYVVYHELQRTSPGRYCLIAKGGSLLRTGSKEAKQQQATLTTATMARQNATSTRCNHRLQSDICITLNPDPRTITWEHLETLRCKQLGLSTKHSRHFNILRTHRPLTDPYDTEHNQVPPNSYTVTISVPRRVNSLAPFSTMGKPTCGYFFSEATNHLKLKSDVQSSNLTKWRSNVDSLFLSAIPTEEMTK